MSDRDKLILKYLRFSGPCSVHFLQQQIPSLSHGQVYRTLYRLRKGNMAVRANRAVYDITRRGRRVFDESLPVLF